MKKSGLLLTAIFFFIMNVYSQQPKLPLLADSLATGNYKDALNNFFQLAFDKIAGPDKEIKFTTNPYAVMAKLNSEFLIDTIYYKYRRLRNLNISIATKLDSSYKFNGFSSGVKYAIINKRDETVSRLFLGMVSENQKTQELFALNSGVEAYISSIADTGMQNKVREQKTKFFRGDINFNQLDKDLQNRIRELAKAQKLSYISGLLKDDSKFNVKKTSQQVYDDLKNYFNNRLLWTIGISDTTYKDQFMFSNIVISSEVVKGIDSLKNKDIELNVKAALQYTDDTLKSGQDLKRSVFSIEPGVNFVFKNNRTLKSLFEFKLSGSYYYTFSSLYTNEERNKINLNATIRFRIINDIWIPLEIKYDPESGNVFGLLNVRANFTALGKLLKGSN